MILNNPNRKVNGLDSGFLILDKPQGLSSQEAVLRVRKCLGVPKAGHTGTLDPLATGVLPIAWGEATKVIPFLDETLKEYSVQGLLGIATDTYDAEGSVASRGDFSSVTREVLEMALREFCGELSQVPPLYSAVKVGGQPAYRYARRGKTVPRPPRMVTFHRLELSSFKPPYFDLDVVCSRGTYIRSLIHDLGSALGCFAHVRALKRLRTGDFSMDHALSLETLERHPQHAWEKTLSIEQVLSKLPKISLEAEELDKALSGARLPRVDKIIETQGISGALLALTAEEKITALWKRDLQGKWNYARVLRRASRPI